MLRSKHIIHLLLLSFLGMNQVYAQQQISVTAKLSADSLIVGNQVKYSLIYDGSEPGEIIFPNFTDTLIDKVYIVKAGELIHNKEKKPLYSREFVITAFDTGIYNIAAQNIKAVFNGDTLELFTDSLSLEVLPYMLMDTIKRDTVFAQHGGIVVWGRDNFDEKMAQMIPDSVRKTLKEDQLKNIQDSLKDVLTQEYASELFRKTGFKDQASVDLIVAGSLQSIFILYDNAIVEKHRIPGANDTVFVQEYDTVQPGQALFVAIPVKDICESLYNTPLTWAEFWWRLMQFLKHNWWWLLLVLIAVVGTVYYFFFRKKGIRQLFKRIPPPEPAHITALRELNRIRDEKKWQTGKTKDFYTELTDTIRKYFEGRYGVFAMEMTSDEILTALAEIPEISQNDLDLLRQTLYLADAVKFAKAEPMFHENDMCLKNAFLLVEKTMEKPEADLGKLVEAEIEVEPEKPEENNNV